MIHLTFARRRLAVDCHLLAGIAKRSRWQAILAGGWIAGLEG